MNSLAPDGRGDFDALRLITGQARFTSSYRRTGLTLVLWAFFDESGKLADSDFICLCGYVAGEDWDCFSSDWRRVLQRHKLPFMHTARFYGGKPPYDGLDWDKDRKDAVCGELSDIVCKNVVAGFGVAVDAKYYKGMKKEDREILGDRQVDVFIFHRLMKKIIEYLQAISYEEPISINFDWSEDYSLKCLSALAKLQRHRAEVRSLIGSIGFCNDEVYYPLQAADMLAYGTKRNLQGDAPGYFKALTEGRPPAVTAPYYSSEYYDADCLNRLCAQLRAGAGKGASRERSS